MVNPKGKMLGEHPEDPSEESSKNFLDPSMELRRLFAELWGTFLLVVVSAGSHVAASQSDQISLGMQAAAAGLIVMAVFYFMGSVSGAHINPCVTLAFAVRGNFPWKRVPGYLLSQLIGGILAALLLKLLFGEAIQLGTTTPSVESWKAILIEILLTTGLVNVILGTATGARNIGHNGALAIGGYIALSGFWADPLTGASMNPARSLSIDCVCGQFSTSWIYVIAPLIGAMIAVIFEWFLRGRPTDKGTANAQGEDGHVEKCN